MAETMTPVTTNELKPAYYSFLNKDPSRLHCFYTKRSTLIHSIEGEETSACYGQQEIHNKIMSLQFEDCKVFISNVDSQASAQGGIIVQVIGEQSNRGGQWKKFAQTFFLAEQPNGYFVLNDICRYIKEEGDEEEPKNVVVDHQQQSTETAVTSPGPQEIETSQIEPSKSSLFADDTYSSVQETFPTSVVAPVVANGTEVPASSTKEADDVPASLSNGHNILSGDSSKPEASTLTSSTAAAPEAITPTPPKTESIVEPITPEVPALALTETPSSPTVPLERVVEETPASIAEASSSSAVPSTSTPVQPEASTSTIPAAPTPSSAPASASASTSKSIEPTQTPIVPPTPAPSAPKSWASLAATAASKKSSIISNAKGVSIAPVSSSSSNSSTTPQPRNVSGSSTPTTNNEPNKSTTNANAAGADKNGSTPKFNEQILSINTPMCYIKGVQENVGEKTLKDVLTSRFGPMCECSIIRSKACAFVEFETLHYARKALQASLPRSEGGEGGVRIPVDPNTMPNHKDSTIVYILERKEHGERPPKEPRKGPGGGRNFNQLQTQSQGQGHNTGTAGQAQVQGQKKETKSTSGGGNKTGTGGAKNSGKSTNK